MHVAMKRCHIAQWRDGIKRSGKTGIPFRTTSVQDDPTWSSTPYFPIGCWYPMNCAWVSSGSRSRSQNCVPHSARHSELQKNCSAFDTPRNFRGETMTPLCSHTGIVRPVRKGKWRLHSTVLEVSSLWTKPGFAHINQTWNPKSNKWKHPGSTHPK